ncbi:MAG: NUDIX hydrolase [Archangiaceae bacterium]|nr:NUDIX hydrolase [Archangiaceae bacterium]
MNARDYPRPSVSVDLVVLTIVDAQLRVLLVKRKIPPFKGSWALPGGFVRVGEGDDQGEDLDAAARRELQEETGLGPDRVFLEQLFTFGKAGRDPRMRVITVAYYALVRPDLAPLVRAGGDVSDAEWVEVSALEKMELAFDHRDIAQAALERVRGKLDYSDIAFELVPVTFTIPELRHVYAIVAGREVDPGNFRRRFNRMMENGVLEKAPGKRITVSKPATVYRFKRAS